MTRVIVACVFCSRLLSVPSVTCVIVICVFCTCLLSVPGVTRVIDHLSRLVIVCILLLFIECSGCDTFYCSVCIL